MVDRLWERLDQAISNRESQLEATIGKYDKMQKTYDHLNKDIKRLTSNLNTLKDQLANVSPAISTRRFDSLLIILLVSLSLCAVYEQVLDEFGQLAASIGQRGFAARSLVR